MQRKHRVRRVQNIRNKTNFGKYDSFLKNVIIRGIIAVIIVTVFFTISQFSGGKEWINTILQENKTLTDLNNEIIDKISDIPVFSGFVSKKESTEVIDQKKTEDLENEDVIPTSTLSPDDISELSMRDIDYEYTLLSEINKPKKSVTPQPAVAKKVNTTVTKPTKPDTPDNVITNKMNLKLTFINPVIGGWISSPFGFRIHPVENIYTFHYGLDIAAPINTNIKSVAKGTVESVGVSSVYGKYIVIKHVNGVSTFYGHCNKIFYKEGKRVSKGTVIAQIGNTGVSTGPHTHFEIRQNGKIFNPELYIKI